MNAPPVAPPGRRNALFRKLLALLLSANVAFLGSTAFLGWKLENRPVKEPDPQALLNDPALLENVLSILVEGSRGVLDVHADPDVALLYQPKLDVWHAGEPFVTSRVGLPGQVHPVPRGDKDVALVALLGDEFVAEAGVPRGEGLEARLRQALTRFRKKGPAFEIVRIGVEGWNGLSQARYLRRQLGDLQPDLVVHLLARNDLDDTPGVRGWGAPAAFAPRHAGRGHAVVRVPEDAPGFVWNGWETRTRQAELADELERLAQAVQSWGGAYLLVPEGSEGTDGVVQLVQGRLAGGRIASLPDDVRMDRERLHRALFAVITQFALLPELVLDPWPTAEEETAEWLAAGSEEVRRRSLRDPGPAALDELVFGGDVARDPQGPSARRLRAHVYAGVDLEGFAAPYASLLLGRGAGDALAIEGAFLPRPAMDGATVRVLVDDVEVGTLEAQAGAAIDARFPLPEDVGDPLTVRLVSSDWVLAGDDLRQCLSLQLRRVSTRP